MASSGVGAKMLILEFAHVLECLGLSLLCVLLVSDCSISRAAVVSDTEHGYAEEYCELETFRPQCMKNEIIVIESAIYGRRYVSRCLKREKFDFVLNPSFLGCYADVMGYLGTRCSGKKQCEIRIPDADLQQATPCPVGLDMFLEVRYSCVEVVEEDRSCAVSVTSTPLHIAKPSASLSSVPQSNTGLHCGTKNQPWLLESPAGQRINIAMIDFSTAVVNVDSSAEQEDSKPPVDTRSPQITVHSCASHQHSNQMYGYIIDKSAAVANKKNVSICGTEGSQRLTNIYMSTSNTVELVLRSTSEHNSTSNFLVRVEGDSWYRRFRSTKAVGCSDLIPPEDAWLKRTENSAIVGCYTSRQTWHLKCEDRRWIGVVSNCTQYANLDSVLEYKQPAPVTEMSDHQLFLIVAVVFIGIAVCLTIICCGVYCLRRYPQTDKSIIDNGNGKKYTDFASIQRTKFNDADVAPATASGDTTVNCRSLNVMNGERVPRFHGAAGTSSPHQYFVLDQNAVAMSTDEM